MSNPNPPNNFLVPLWTRAQLQALWPAARLGILSPVLTPNDFIYLFEIWEGLQRIFKIGRSNNPPRRCQCIRRRCGPTRQRIIAVVRASRSHRTEPLMHIDVVHRLGWTQYRSSCRCNQDHREKFQRNGTLLQVLSEFFNSFAYTRNK
ncbi:hypothetical protein PM082_022778 [Marasmius tenuissimus]|nr:hypothetical protein PM082_022778 [Marasmius tenuissimus]